MNLGRPPKEVAFQTALGRMLCGKAEDVLRLRFTRRLAGKFQLIFTSPPFPLNNKKRYGNKTGEDYLEWLAEFAPLLVEYLAPRGSIVIELGNAWERGSPTMSTLAVEALLEFKRRGELHLCQEFVWHNPARLPTPAQWVNVERIRVKDSFTRLWWMSPTERPKADNRKVLQEYSDAMRQLLRTRRYNAGRRPSEHSVGATSFFKDHGGSIPSNVIAVANTDSKSCYHSYCREHEIELLT